MRIIHLLLQLNVRNLVDYFELSVDIVYIINNNIEYFDLIRTENIAVLLTLIANYLNVSFYIREMLVVL